MTPAALLKLQSMAAQVEMRDMAALRRARDQVAALHAARAALDATQADIYAADSLAVGAAYGDWLRLEQARIALALRKAEAAAAAARGGAARSLARRQVLDGLLIKAKAKALMRDRRRAEQNGMPADR